MEAQVELKKILKAGQIQNELELERAAILDRKLRVLVKEHPEFAPKRKQLRQLIADYEAKHWSNGAEISEEQIKQSDDAELIAEYERLFIEKRKKIIKGKLSDLKLTQQDLGQILGHGKSYMSELMNGISPLSMRDLIIISRLFQIDLKDLVPMVISVADQMKLRNAIKLLNKPNIKLQKKDFSLRRFDQA